MKQKWDEVSDINSKINFNWLDKTDENNCRIVWEYLYKNLPSFMFLYAPAPINNMERYLIIKAYFYAYTYMQSESDKLFHLQQIKKRITTARYREKKENEKKVLLQTYISVDAKKQLKYLANKLDTPICKLVEKLIKNVYMDYNDKV